MCAHICWAVSWSSGPVLSCLLGSLKQGSLGLFTLAFVHPTSFSVLDNIYLIMFDPDPAENIPLTLLEERNIFFPASACEVSCSVLLCTLRLNQTFFYQHQLAALCCYNQDPRLQALTWSRPCGLRSSLHLSPVVLSWQKQLSPETLSSIFTSY